MHQVTSDLSPAPAWTSLMPRSQETAPDPLPGGPDLEGRCHHQDQKWKTVKQQGKSDLPNGKLFSTFLTNTRGKKRKSTKSYINLDPASY